MAFPITGLRLLHAWVVHAGVLLTWLVTWPAHAHEMPTDVRVTAFVKPAGQTLELLIRLPMASAMREVELPLDKGGHLIVSKADEALLTAARMWLADGIALSENGKPLPKLEVARALATLPSDTSFQDYGKARAHLDEPRLSDALDLNPAQLLLDVRLVTPITSDRAAFSVDIDVRRLGEKVQTSLRFLPPGGVVRPYELHGNAGLVHLDPRWWQSASRFVVSGVEHILTGLDHLLFLACLVIPFQQLRPMVAIVTAFTLAHSVTLIAAALGFAPDGLWFPPLIETLIAVSIVYMALENILGESLERRWVLAFAFGLIHGFGFSFALGEELQFAGSHLLTALLTFNLGVEVGQLAVLVVLVPVLTWFFRRLPDERMGVIVLSALVAHTAWHWMLERGGQLGKFPLPNLDAALAGSLMRMAMVALILAGLIWLASDYVRRWLAASAEQEPPTRRST